MTKAKTIRLLGLACMISAIIFSLNGIWEVLQPSMMESGRRISIIGPFHSRTQSLVFGLLCAPGFFAGQLGYYLSGAAGKGWFSKVIIALAAVGAAMYLTGSVFRAVTLRNNLLFGLGLPLSQWLSTLLLGVVALFVRKVSVWKRVWPIWLGVIPQLLFPLYIFVFGWPAFAALATNGLNWLVFGYAVYTEGKGTQV